MTNVLRFQFCLAALLAATAAAAQQAKPAHPADPAAPAPAVGHDSAFAGYNKFRDEKLSDWRNVNDEVGRVGGHVGILRGDKGAAGAPKAPGAHTK